MPNLSLDVTPLPAEWFARDVNEVARDLLGAELSATTAEGTVTVRLTEVEAYGGAEDPGSHARRGPTARNASMFASAGRVYVYFTYGMHWCANLVTGPEGEGSAVLLRAGEVIEGLELARRRRPSSRSDRDLASGPARLAKALGLTGEHDGLEIGGAAAAGTGSMVVELRAAPAGVTAWERGPRTGVSGPGGSAAEFPWRYWIAGDPTVSRYRAA
ncbi:DNA-3-methyladenine glycosylase [Salana multivorans]|uniref:Putative 3-methyladenine DNA glycosylase n=1 Tax=Salana multivorans TaxID=120377 RepID=A0A3N2D2B0_9MICO|nr:DNA-3-methyladenine glycosylase [Salana multivorans]ROR93788.1 DNA-3-methyladenine glycosylase [Salana multivorans]